jgi:hypothetical protein
MACLGTYNRNEETNELQLEGLNMKDQCYASPPHDGEEDWSADMSTLKWVILPAKDNTRLDEVLEHISQKSPTIRSLTITHSYDDLALPPLSSLTSIRLPSISGRHSKSQMEMWCTETPSLRYLSIGDFFWVNECALDTCLEDIYDLPKEDDFSWSKLDQSHLYAWPDKWCLCFAKKGPSSFLVEHPITMCHYLTEVRGFDFPYIVNLSWKGLKERIQALARHHAIINSYAYDSDF